jgi:hypothetical protein
MLVNNSVQPSILKRDERYVSGCLFLPTRDILIGDYHDENSNRVMMHNKDGKHIRNISVSYNPLQKFLNVERPLQDFVFPHMSHVCVVNILRILPGHVSTIIFIFSLMFFTNLIYLYLFLVIFVRYQHVFFRHFRCQMDVIWHGNRSEIWSDPETIIRIWCNPET